MHHIKYLVFSDTGHFIYIYIISRNQNTIVAIVTCCVWRHDFIFMKTYETWLMSRVGSVFLRNCTMGWGVHCIIVNNFQGHKLQTNVSNYYEPLVKLSIGHQSKTEFASCSFQQRSISWSHSVADPKNPYNFTSSITFAMDLDPYLNL